MKTNVPLISSLRKPFRSLLLLILFGLISFGFVTKAVGFILVQRETGVLGSYYRSIGVLENIEDPQAGDISAGIELIETSPFFAYGDQRERVSGVMPETYNQNIIDSNNSYIMNVVPQEYWPNTHTYDIWFTGDLIDKEEIKTRAKLPENQRTVGYYLKFNINTLFAGYPDYASQGKPVGLLFL
ncbi:MAG: hypothetical protein NTW99_13490, partial [Chloroflexi bacterium]|nr:hypothetical protein [Chloroflexota bacterium]